MSSIDPLLEKNNKKNIRMDTIRSNMLACFGFDGYYYLIDDYPDINGNWGYSLCIFYGDSYMIFERGN